MSRHSSLPAHAQVVPGATRPARRVKTFAQRALERAEQSLAARKYDEAARVLAQIVAEGLTDAECALRVAGLYRELRLWRQALYAVERAIALQGATFAAYEMLLATALEAGDRPRALAASHALIKIAPRHIPAHSAQGAVYIQMGDVEAAMRVANTLIRLDPDTAAHHFKKALLCQHQGEVALAVHEFSQTIRLDPDGPHAGAAREAVETLDVFQINHILTLAMEDVVFRAKLQRDPVEAVIERGFALSDNGGAILTELAQHALPEFPHAARPLFYN